MSSHYLLFVLLLNGVVFASSSRILVLLGAGTKSHRSMYDPLCEELGRRGHEVVHVSMYPSKKNSTNVREIGPQNLDIKTLVPNAFDDTETPGLKSFVDFVDGTLALSYDMVTSPELRELFDPAVQKFDLIIVNGVLNELFLGFVHVHKVPFVYVSTMVNPMPWTHGIVGNPLNTAVDPLQFVPYQSRMNLLQRLWNTVGTTMTSMVRNYYMVPRINEAAKKVFGSEMPPVEVIERQVSAVLVNSYFSVSYPRPTLPNLIEVGGVHCRDAKPLTNDLAKFVDGSDDRHGFIYFSFGSVVHPKDMPTHIRQAFVDAFAEIPQRVVWKWHSDHIDGLSSNVKLGQWLPQQDILGHPKIRAFITHAGLFSTMETVYHGVPVIGVPFFGDQHLNMAHVVHRGEGLQMDFKNLTKDIIVDTINEIVNNTKYRDNVKRRSLLFRDRETRPLDKAVYWVEYVLRHKGAYELRSVAAEMTWFQINLIDVYSIIVIGNAFVLYIFYKMVCLCRGKRHNKEKVH